MRYFSGLLKQVCPFFTVLGSLPELHFLQVSHSNSSLASEILLFWNLNKLDTRTKTNCMKTYNFSWTKLCQKRKLNHDTTNQVATFISQKVRKISLQLLYLFLFISLLQAWSSWRREWYCLWRIRLGHCRWVLTYLLMLTVYNWSLFFSKKSSDM